MCSRIRFLFVCTANQCRSPMAKGLYRLRAQEAGCRPEVASAGFLEPGVPVPAQVADVMAGWGVNLERHRSRRLDLRLVQQADVVATMTRQQLLDLAVTVGDEWMRCFTLVDLVRRAEAVGPPAPSQDPKAWVGRLQGARTRSELLRLDLADDIADPSGGRRSAYQRTADELDALISRLVDVVCPTSSGSRT